MSVKKVVEGIYRVFAGAGVFIVDGDRVAIIDTGLPQREDAILSAVRAIGRAPSDVDDILVTHYHPDHVGSLGPLTAATGAKVWAPRGDAALIREGGSPPPMEKKGVAGMLFARFAGSKTLPPHRVDEEIGDGDEIDVAGGIKVVGTPGHTPGHVVFLRPAAGGFLFLGDAAWNMTKLDRMPVNEDFSLAEKSLGTIAELDFEAAGFGHGSSITGGAAQRFRRAAARYGG